MIHLGDGLQTSALGFGGMAITDVYGTTDPAAALEVLHKAIDVGVSFIDTADVYGSTFGANEETIAKVLDTRRDEVQLATKFGILGFDFENGMQVRGDRDYIRQACEDSLRRLGVEHIDLYYMHRRELSRPIEETVAAMAELVKEGKVRHLGLSEVTAEELRAAHEVHPIAAVQSEWSLWSRDVEKQVVPTAAQLGVGFVPYSPLGRGFLTGKLDKAQLEGTVLAGEPRYDQHHEANQALVSVIDEVAAERGASAAQVALAWLWAKGREYGLPVVPIPGTRRSERVVENAAALEVELDAAQMTRLDALVDRVHGGRNFTFTSDDWISSGRE